MTQLFLTLADAEACAAFVLPWIDEAIEMSGNRRLWRRKLELIRDRLALCVDSYGTSDWIDDEGGPYLKMFDALSFITQAARSFEFDAQAVNAARDLLVGVAR